MVADMGSIGAPGGLEPTYRYQKRVAAWSQMFLIMSMTLLLYHAVRLYTDRSLFDKDIPTFSGGQREVMVNFLLILWGSCGFSALPAVLLRDLRRPFVHRILRFTLFFQGIAVLFFLPFTILTMVLAPLLFWMFYKMNEPVVRIYYGENHSTSTDVAAAFPGAISDLLEPLRNTLEQRQLFRIRCPECYALLRIRHSSLPEKIDCAFCSASFETTETVARAQPYEEE